MPSLALPSPATKIILVAAYTIIGAIVLRRLELYPSMVTSADALGYVSFGHSFPSLVPLGTMRTYGYPLMTWVYSHLGGGLDPLSCALIGGVVQLIAYGAAVIWLASEFERPTSVAIAAGLLLNPVLVGVVADMLTEAPSLIIAVLIVVFLVKLSRFPSQALAWASAGALLTNFAFMIRPSNIVLIVAWNVAVLFALRGRMLALYAAAFVVTAIAAWTPQVLHNLSLGHFTVLPVYPLFDRQVSVGIAVARYASIVHDGSAWSPVLLNPWRANYADPTLTWYFAEPLEGIATLGLHILSAFTFDRVFTYLYDCKPLYWLAGLMWAVVAFGALQGARMLRHKFKQPAVIAVALMFFLTVGLIAITAPENRFATIPLAILSVLAWHFVATFQGKPKWFVAVAVADPLLGWQFSHTLNDYQTSENYVRFGCPK